MPSDEPGGSPEKCVPLAEAIRRYVKPGMHLNFASTPSRSNAAIRELGRRFRGTSPAFTLSATGFHSTAHLLGLLRLGKRYISCFFGDNYPTPKPNPLYETLLEEGAELEHWSLLTYVSALRAGAQGHRYALVHSLSGTTLGEELRSKGQYVEFPDPVDPGKHMALVRAISPDIAFLHAPVGEAQGLAMFSAPYCEGFYGAHAAKQGVIITVDHLVEASLLAARPDLLPIPRHRVLAICHAPFGAHPQPVHVSTEFPIPLGYRDDYAQYGRWRELSSDTAIFNDFCRAVLDGEEPEAYENYVGAERLRQLSRAVQSRSRQVYIRENSESVAPVSGAVPRSSLQELSSSERVIVLAARCLSRRIVEAKHQCVLAGIGLAFAAARLGKVLLGEASAELELMVETGLCGFADGTQQPNPAGHSAWHTPSLHPFLLSSENIAQTPRLTGVDDVLGTLVCGTTTRCIGIVGAAQVDPAGAVNSTRVSGKLVVGSGGANDILTAASEAIVLTRWSRLVRQLEYITSPGDRVVCVVTERGVLQREAGDRGWRLLCLPGDRIACVAELNSKGWQIIACELLASAKLSPEECRVAELMREPLEMALATEHKTTPTEVGYAT